MKRFLEDIQANVFAFKSIFDFIVDLVFFMEIDGNSFRYVYVNKSAKNVLNAQEDVFNRRIEEVLPQEKAEKLNEYYMQVQTTKQPVSFVETIETENGEFFGETTLSPIITKEGECKYILAIVRDITEQKKLERLFQKSQEKYRLITENAFDIIKLINPVGIIEYVSPSIEKILGYNPAEYIGQLSMINIHPDDIPVIKEKYVQLVQGDNVSFVEIRVRHKSGHYLWMEASTTPVMERGRIKQFVTIERDITDRKSLQDELEKAAFYDYLSGLPNRRTFDDRLEHTIHQANQLKRKVALMLIDGHRFKMINDNYGHDIGDAVIKEMARRILESVRKTDTVARIGGDEMAVILPNLNSVDEAEEIAKRILQSFEEPLHFNNNIIKMGAGIGIAIYPEHSNDKRKLIKFADEALYEAKERGRNEYRFYS